MRDKPQMDTTLIISIVLMLATVCGGQEKRLEFITEPESIFTSADGGNRATFKCSASSPDASIKWLHNGTIIHNDSYDWIKINHNKLVIRMPKSSRGGDSNRLQSDEFQCLAELNDQVIVSQPAKLIVAELSPFTDQPDINVTTIVGNTVVIPCSLPRSIPFAVAEFQFNNLTIINFKTGKFCSLV